ncbi:hypothetical protein AAFF_G00308010 [Aldrovandia affinis]|uniref:Uncharacterized protein n=1 Tax=Aldrovandia affinis TaxID=143900 RepID=A0AAD7R7Y8_9TELE|nr:hypothetical protein AAFF_G00308010 [Aldrovandia affinis]
MLLKVISEQADPRYGIPRASATPAGQFSELCWVHASHASRGAERNFLQRRGGSEMLLDNGGLPRKQPSFNKVYLPNLASCLPQDQPGRSVTLSV